MIQVVNSAEAVKRRRVYKSPGTGIEHWAIAFFGNRGTQVKDEPEALMTEMSSDETIVSHFHAVDQFQVFVAGSGTLGRHDAQPVTLQYIDRHTGYGPIQAGPHGLSYIVLRAQTDVGAVYLNQPGYREKLKPSKKRNRLSGPVVLSTEPVLTNRTGMALEPLPLLQEKDAADGVAAFMLRLGANSSTTGPDPQLGGGYYILVVNPIKDFAPVATLDNAEQMLVINPSLPANNLQELIALARSRPGQLNYASAGTASATHLAGELFNIMTGVKITHIPYKGSGQVIPDLIGGHVQMHFNVPISLLPHVKSGKLRGIAVSGDTRLMALPQMPTFNEAGLKGFEVAFWHGVLAPAGTPTHIARVQGGSLSRLRRAFARGRHADDISRAAGQHRQSGLHRRAEGFRRETKA